MKRMSFAATTAQMRDRTKTVTRRVTDSWGGLEGPRTVTAREPVAPPLDQWEPYPDWASGIRQTIFHEEGDDQAGNCLQAAVASISAVPLDDVPHFAYYCRWDDEDSDPHQLWWHAYHGFFAARLEQPHGLIVVDDGTVPERLCLVTGQSPRGDWKHVVVYLLGGLFWDPHPSDDGILDVSSVDVPVPLSSPTL